ncbi:MAG: hypothetical protein EP319_03785 [Deltaproteobacteria bacterium]|nr:MAG: hypothetical protein EP319_03785 [Deltaproteobacteria bacterium]
MTRETGCIKKIKIGGSRSIFYCDTMKNTLFILVMTLVSVSAEASNCIAHRGNNHLYLENSHRAIMSAVEVAADGVEFDVRHTKDGFPILMHDKDMDRTATHKEDKKCNLKADVSELMLSEILENCQLKNGEEIPLLEDVLRDLEPHDLFVFIELKDKPQTKTFEVIETYMASHPGRVRIISFKYKFIKLIRKLSDPSGFWKEIKTMWITKVFGWTRRSDGADVNHLFRLNLWLQRLRGKETAVWTVDSEKRLTKLLKAKIDFITTNRPELCLDLKKNFH